MRKHLDKSCFWMTSGCFLHTHTHLGNDSMVYVFRPDLFDVTTERKQRSGLGDHDMANWIRDVSCWCHGRSCPVVFPFPPSPSYSTSSSQPSSMAVKLGMDFYWRSECFRREMWSGDERRTTGHPKHLIYTPCFADLLTCTSLAITTPSSFGIQTLDWQLSSILIKRGTPPMLMKQSSYRISSLCEYVNGNDMGSNCVPKVNSTNFNHFKCVNTVRTVNPCGTRGSYMYSDKLPTVRPLTG